MAHSRWRFRTRGWRRHPRTLPALSRLMLTAYLLTALVLAEVIVLAGRIAAPWNGRAWRPSGGAWQEKEASGSDPAARQEAFVRRAALAQGLDPGLVTAVIEVESGFDPLAVSPKGARGLMQIMPSTWRELNPNSACRGEHDPPAAEPGCIFSPEANVISGTRYLRTLLDRFSGDVALALAAYNAGAGAVADAARPGEAGAIPALAETRRYVGDVLDRWTRGRTGLTYRETRNLSWLLGVARWLLWLDGVILGVAIVARPSWAGGVRRWGR